MSTHNSPRSSSSDSLVPSGLPALISGDTDTIDAHTAPRKATLPEPKYRNTSASYHHNPGREPQHTEGVQEHVNRPPTCLPRFSTERKCKKWLFNLLDALKKVFCCERNMSKIKGWM